MAKATKQIKIKVLNFPVTLLDGREQKLHFEEGNGFKFGTRGKWMTPYEAMLKITKPSRRRVRKALDARGLHSISIASLGAQPC